MTLSTSELSSWDLQSVSQLELFSILVQSISLSPVFCAMMRPLVIINSKSTIQSQEDSSREIRCIRDARPCPTICINLTPTRSCLRPLQSWLMDQPSSRDSSGKITLAFSHLKLMDRALFNSRWNSNRINAHPSNSLLCINLKVSVTIPMEFWDSPHTRTWRKRSSTIYIP